MANSIYITSLFSHIAAANCNNTYFLGLKPWYYYLQLDQNCNVINFTVLDPGHPSSFILILLALIDDLLILAGLLAVVFVIVAGIKYTTSQGDAGTTAKAQSTIINSLIGLAVAVIAVNFVAFIGNKLSGNASGGGVTALGIDFGPLPFTPGADSGSIILTVLSIVFSITGALSFLFVVIGGFRYVGARGEPQGVASAKKTIIYAIVGLVITLLAQAIVSAVSKWL